MAKNKKSFILYADYITTIEELTDIEAGKLTKHLFKYVNDLNPEPPEDRVVKLAFEPMKQQLKRDLREWEEKKLKRSEAGKVGGVKSGESRKQNEAKPTIDSSDEAKPTIANDCEANEAVTVNVTVNDNVIVNIVVGEDERTETEMTQYFDVDVGLRRNWEQKGLPREKFVLGVQLWFWQNIGKKYKDIIDVRQHFLYWMPNFYKAAAEAKKENNGTTTNNKTGKLSRGEAGQVAVLNDLKNELGING